MLGRLARPALLVLIIATGLPTAWSSDLSRSTLEKDRALLVERLTGEFIARDPSSYMDTFNSTAVKVEGRKEPAIYVEEFFDKIAYEIFGEELKKMIKIRTFGSPISEDLSERELRSMGYTATSVYTFDLHPGSGSIVMHRWRITTGRVLVPVSGRQNGPTPEISKKYLERMKGCEVRFRRQGEVFVGVPSDAQCSAPTKKGIVRTERHWRVAGDEISIDRLSELDGVSDSQTLRQSSVHRCRYFILQLYGRKNTGLLGEVNAMPQRVADQNGSAMFGPVSDKNGPVSDPWGTGSPRLFVNVDREGDNRVLTGHRWFSQDRIEQAFRVEIPPDVEEFAVKFDDATLELRAEENSRRVSYKELKEGLPGEYSVDPTGNRYQQEVSLHVVALPESQRWYLELVDGNDPEHPIFQRVLELMHGSMQDPSSIRMSLFRPRDPDLLLGIWRNPDQMAAFDKKIGTMSKPCKFVLRSWGNAWRTSWAPPCGPDPHEAFAWRFEKDRVEIERSVYAPEVWGGYVRRKWVLDRVDSEVSVESETAIQK